MPLQLVFHPALSRHTIDDAERGAGILTRKGSMRGNIESFVLTEEVTMESALEAISLEVFRSVKMSKTLRVSDFTLEYALEGVKPEGNRFFSSGAGVRSVKLKDPTDSGSD